MRYVRAIPANIINDYTNDTGVERVPANPGRSRTERPIEERRAIEFRLQLPLSQTAFSIASQFAIFLFYLSPHTRPSYLASVYIVLPAVIREPCVIDIQIVEEIPPSRAPPLSTSDRARARLSLTTHSSVTHPLCSDLVVTLDPRWPGKWNGIGTKKTDLRHTTSAFDAQRHPPHATMCSAGTHSPVPQCPHTDKQD